MPRHLTVGSAIEVTRVSSNVAFLEMLDIEVVDEAGTHIDWIRVVKNNETITYQGNVYTPADFSIDIAGGLNEQPKLTISLQDPYGIVREAINAYQGGTDFPVTYTLLNTARMSSDPEIQETFIVTSATATGEWQVSFELGMDGALAKRVPRRSQFNNRCSHLYKDSRCAYAGAMATCDYSLFGTNGCQVHNNVANFGGFPGLADRF